MTKRRAGLEPLARIADLGREDDSRKEEQVLRPLPRPKSHEERDRRLSPSLQRNDGANRLGKRHAGILLAHNRHEVVTVS